MTPCDPVCRVPHAPGRTLRSSFLLLLLVSASWLFGLLAVNHSVLAFHYLHAGLCGLQVSRPCPRPDGAAGRSRAGIGSRRVPPGRAFTHTGLPGLLAACLLATLTFPAASLVSLESGLTPGWPGAASALSSLALVSNPRCPQGLAVLLLFCVLDADARAAWAPACLRKKAAPEEARPAPGTVGGSRGREAGVRGFSWMGSPPSPTGAWGLQ